MQVRSILFGFGLGMILLSAVFLLVYRFEQPETLSDYEIIEQAEELGMVWPTDDMAEIVRRALEIGMVFEEGG